MHQDFIIDRPDFQGMTLPRHLFQPTALKHVLVLSLKYYPSTIIVTSNFNIL